MDFRCMPVTFVAGTPLRWDQREIFSENWRQRLRKREWFSVLLLTEQSITGSLTEVVRFRRLMSMIRNMRIFMGRQQESPEIWLIFMTIPRRRSICRIGLSAPARSWINISHLSYILTGGYSSMHGNRIFVNLQHIITIVLHSGEKKQPLMPNLTHMFTAAQSMIWKEGS